MSYTEIQEKYLDDLRHHRTTLSKLWSNYDDVKNGADLPNFVRKAH